MELATFENTVFAFEPIKRIVPTTRTRITASMTAYSAMSCPSSSDHILLISSRMGSLLRARFREQEGTDLKQCTHDARACTCLSNADFRALHHPSVLGNGRGTRGFGGTGRLPRKQVLGRMLCDLENTIG